jgi:XFP N-terminal domain
MLRKSNRYNASCNAEATINAGHFKLSIERTTAMDARRTRIPQKRTHATKKGKMTPLTEIEELARPLSAEGLARSTVAGAPLSPDELNRIDSYWRACKYLALGMIYLQANPLLKESLKPEHIKSRLLGHWGSSPGLAFLYTHLSRLIKRDDLEMIFLAGPGHAGSSSAHIP